MRIAVTGGLACGKSEVGNILAKAGIMVMDTDQVAHEVMQPGGTVHAGILASFGPAVLAADGSINRKALADVVFRDPKALERLNSLVHPAVRQVYQGWVREQSSLDHVTAVLIPLLFERGLEQGWDAILCVGSPADSVRQRLLARGMDGAEADRRLAAQWPVEEKMRRASHRIWNDGNLDQLKTQTLAVLHNLFTKKKETSHGR